MTVTVRPFPTRTYQNGIRPFRPVVPSNNIRPYTLKTWRPPTPEPLPPAPLFGPKELLALGALVLAQLWGKFASRPRTSERASGVNGGNVTGTAPPVGNTVGGNLTVTRTAGSFTYSTVADCSVTTNGIAGTYQTINTSGVVAVQLIQEAGSCGPRTFTWRITRTTGAVQDITTESVGYGYGSVGFGHVVSWSGPGAVAWPTPSVSLPLPDGYVAPSPEPEPEADPLTLPVPLPLPPLPAAPPTTVPGGPQPLPLSPPFVVPTTPGPAAPPATAPQLPTRPAPQPLPGATPTKDGAIVPQAPATVPTTPPDAHFPVPGAPPVTGNGPRPTPEGIAQELGRLEQKLARLSDPGPSGPGDGTDRLGLLFQILGQLVEFLTAIQSGGGYGLSSPCDLDENGERIITTVEYSGAPTTLGVVLNKIDALAALLQVHKDLKQPICKQTPAVGQPVTVNFVQVD